MLVTSTMMPLGTRMPSFHLPNYSIVGPQMVRGEDLLGKHGLVVLFWCNHCPYVQHVQKAVLALIRAYTSIGFVMISANDVDHYPEDSPEMMRLLAQESVYPCPYLFDEDQQVAKAFDAACTPDVFVFDAQLACIYRGRIDGTTPGRGGAATAEDLQTVCSAMVKGKPLQIEQHPSQGCNIKWRPSQI